MHSVARPPHQVVLKSLALVKPTRCWPALVTLLCCALLIFLRADLVEHAYGEYSGCEGCFAPKVWAQDGIYISALLLIYALAATLLWQVRWLIMMGIAIAITALALDVMVFKAFNTRLYWADLLKFGLDTKALSSVAFEVLRNATVIAAAALGIFAVLAWGWHLHSLAKALPGDRARAAAWLAGIAMVIILLSSLTPPLAYVVAQSVENVWQVNRLNRGAIPYSDEFASTYRNIKEKTGCELRPLVANVAIDPAAKIDPVANSQQQQPVSVIVLMVESLSAVHSVHSGATVSKIPTLDALVGTYGAWASDFWANGFTTDEAYISVLANDAPVPAPDRFQSDEAFAGFGGEARKYYRALRARGYDIAFFGGADLNFLNTKGFFERLDFTEIEDSTAPIYQTPRFAGAARGQFGAVEDAVLFERSLLWIDEHSGSSTKSATRKPFFLSMMTINTHPPFIPPGALLPDHDAAFAYADREISKLVRALQERDFFAHGMLVIVGDHREMTPISAAERATYGEVAAARVPMFVFGDIPRGEIKGRFQQLDILPTLMSILGVSQACKTRFSGQFSPHPMPADYRLHTSGIRRDTVFIEHGDQVHKIILDGDNTRFMPSNSPLPSAESNAIIDYINQQRLLRQQK